MHWLKETIYPNRLKKKMKSSITLFKTMHHFKEKPKVFITRPDVPESALNLLKHCDLDVWNRESNVPRAEFLKRIAGKDALLIHTGDRIDAEALNAAGKNLKVISTLSVGYDHIEVEEVKKRNIKLGYTPEVLSDAVAELAIALLLTLSRRIAEGHSAMLKGGWNAWTKWNWMNGQGLKGAVVGIFGLGHVGLEIGRRILPFKPSKILYTTRKAVKEASELNAVLVPLEQLLRESDVVFVCVTLNEDTKGILDGEKLNLMKSSAVLVNISRGDVINQDALMEVLKSKKIRGAALDVMTPEPLPKNHKLLALDNCYTTPHIGSAETTTRIGMAELASRNLIAGLTGDVLPKEL